MKLFIVTIAALLPLLSVASAVSPTAATDSATQVPAAVVSIASTPLAATTVGLANSEPPTAEPLHLGQIVCYYLPFLCGK
ncbi:MAG: hypothetical protein LBV00_04695 [Propionibacteriaceae bacterium]|jgi:uncharacterized membrane protein (DUF441 family)|nr:hypothetical protein [Propionibacteriaceae bacterium]